MLGGVFICYRREDSAGFARLIYDRLTHTLGQDSVFFDVDNIPVGLDFVDILSERVGKCDALIAVIGRSWASSVDDRNRRRLDDPNDFVRIEIEAALGRKVRVIPVLVDGAAMPGPDDLPDSLKKLTRRQGIEISHTRFDSDVERLTRALSLLEEELRQRDAAEIERAAREERERREAEEAAARAERERQLAEAEAARRADEERREREAAEAERSARQERERRDAAEAVEARQAAEAEAARRLAAEQRHVGWSLAEQTPTGAWDRARRMLGGLSRAGSWGLRLAALAVGGAVVLVLAALVLRSLPPAVMTAAEQPQPSASEQTASRGSPAVAPLPAQGLTPAEETERGDRAFVSHKYGDAMEWYRKSADRGLADAQYNIGELYEDGRGVAKDIDEARVWYQKSADQGYGPAKTALARLQAQPNPSPPPAPAPQEQSLTPAQENDMGNRYLYGSGLDQDYAKAMEWYRKAADHGLGDAQYNVGMMYENGRGVAKDIEQAKAWYRKAADQGSAFGKAALQRLEANAAPAIQLPASTPKEENQKGDDYFYGRGVEQDYGKAMEWYRKAGDQGYAEAQHNVGVLYENGWGVTKDIEQAKVWYKKAADQGDAFAKGALQRLSSPPATPQPSVQTQGSGLAKFRAGAFGPQYR
ncbi:MAG TPA: toll/interleukin-1 receptor domain-containing protein [Methylocystis sp.]|nr:toll/interleukin-1 receptor domain-containing protein [Methylocystis sp.]